MSTDSHPGPPLGLVRRALGYLALAVVAVAVLAVGQRLRGVDLTAPFQDDGDTLLILPMVKAAVERGSHWRNEQLGAPGVQELYDYPVIDHLHFAAVWLVGRCVGDPVVAYNLYYLATYPLAAVAAAAVLRHFGVSPPAAAAAGLLYAFLPYHTQRAEHHYFLSAYWSVPVSLVPALWVCRGRLPFFRRGPGSGRDTATAVAIAALTSAAGAYYAFFACAFLAAAGVYGWVAGGTWRAAAAAALVVGVVVAGGLANHAPTLIHQAEFGRNPAATERFAEECEVHGLKVTHLLLPVAGHQWRTLADVQATYDAPGRPLQTENKWAGLGLIGGAGLVGLLVAAALPVGRGWPVGPLAGLTLFGVVLGQVGGLGALLNHLASSHLRAYNRVSVFLAVFALFAVAWAADRLLAGRPARVRWAVCLLAAGFGLWDQCGRPWFHREASAARTAAAARWRADAAFFGAVERAIPGGAVFTLPYVRYPEDYDNPVGYQQSRGYLHTRTLRFSYGAMKEREVDQWQREVSAAPPAELLRRAVLGGFDAVLVDRRGYPADPLLAAAGPAPRFDHPDGLRTVLDLRPYRDRLRQELGGRFEELARAEREAVRVLWLSGFASPGPLGREAQPRRCEAAGEAVIVNPGDRRRTIVLTAAFRTALDEPAELTIAGDVWTDRLTIDRRSPPVRTTLVVPPGRHPVQFRCRPPASYRPTEYRRFVFSVGEVRIDESPADPPR